MTRPLGLGHVLDRTAEAGGAALCALGNAAADTRLEPRARRGV